MFADYKSHIFLKYKRWRDAQSLSLLLTQPTPGNLRAECVNLCRERFDKKDQEILRSFFGPYENQKAYTRAIAEFDVDKFRPLLNFITERTADTELKNIELLAWLVDVQPRPFQPGYPYEKLPIEPVKNEDKKNTDNAEVSPIVESEVVGSITVMPDIETRSVFFGKRRIFIAALLLLFITVSVYLLWKGMPIGGCMYWTGDHYETVACDKKIDNVTVIAADSDKLQHFKKITRPDTITLGALGHVWYSKMNNKIEFFTADGNHPIQMQYHLKPLTRYMVEKHIYPGMKLE